MAIVNVAFRDAYRELSPAERATILVQIQDAVHHGFTNPKDIAICALERAGYAPRYVVRGEIGLITIRDDGR
ncbi:hypothetical protein [Methylobacterium nodulans]|nr:hypothetical protein [Methylobacterium nodulans]